MTKIDFLSSQAPDDEARLHLACRVAQKALRNGQRVHIACQDAAQAQALDDLLWTFDAESFVPHTLLADDTQTEAPVTLTHTERCSTHQQVLINFRSPVPAYFSSFERLFELVVQTPAVLAGTRANWAYYKSRGYPLDFKPI